MTSKRNYEVRIIATNFTVVALKCGFTAPKIANICNLWYKFGPKGYIPLSDFFIQNLAWGQSLRSQPSRQLSPTRNLPLCNGSIIVLKITMLHSVSVITNFVIPKRDRQKNITLFRLQPARDPQSPPYLAW